MARREAMRILGDAAHGKDPASERKDRQRAEMTMAQLCALYLEEGCHTKKPATPEADRARVEGHLKPLIGRKRLSEIGRADIERFMRDVAEGKSAKTVKTKKRGVSRVKGGKTAATRAVGLLQGMFTFAVERGLVEENPTRGVKRYTDGKRERFLTGAELGELGKALAAMEDEGIEC